MLGGLSHEDLEWWATHGVIGGVLAGIAFAVLEMVIVAWMHGPAAFSTPLRMIGATVLGAGALDPSYSVLVAAGVGAVVHLMFSALFGVGFGVIAYLLPVLRESPGPLLLTASAYGLLLWGVNFYVIAPWAGWRWFPDQSVRGVQFLAHTFAFGTMLGLYLDWVVGRPSKGAIRSPRVEPVEPLRKVS
jgi:hypothetical protein